jgi:hypothetical protein
MLSPFGSTGASLSVQNKRPQSYPQAVDDEGVHETDGWLRAGYDDSTGVDNPVGNPVDQAVDLAACDAWVQLARSYVSENA